MESGLTAFNHDHSLHSLLSRIPVFLWCTDRRLTISLATGAALSRAGVDPARLIGLPVEAIFATPDAIAAHRAALAGSGGSFAVEINGRSLDAHVEPLGNGNSGLAGVALDITERLVAETALRLSEESNRSLVEDAPYGICRATESGQLLQVNPAMGEMLGYGSDIGGDLLMRDLPLIFDDRGSFETLRNTMLAGAAVQGFETVWKRRDGREIQVRLGGSARRSADGSVLCFDLLAENVTEKKELGARLQQAEKMQMIGQLAGGVAHDFNNLLTVINGYCDLLLLESSERGEEPTGLRMIRQAGERASGLTQQLLAFSRKQVTIARAVPLNALVTEVASLSERLIGENIVVERHLAADGGFVMGDPAQLHQILMNLVVNARDAMPAGGTLTLRTASVFLANEEAARLDLEAGRYELLSVSDTGEGMDDNVRAHLFEPFFTTKEVGKGTGLGLATVFALVRKSGGAISVESGPGLGSSFYIYLPRVQGQDTEDTSEVPAKMARGNSTILLVEDDASVRRFTATVLSDAGYTLLQAPDGECALQIAGCHDGPIHLLITDMVMPGLNGMEVAEKVRESRQATKVLLVSGYSEKLADQPLAEGIRYLHKPFSPRRLAEAVNEILSETKAFSAAI